MDRMASYAICPNTALQEVLTAEAVLLETADRLDLSVKVVRSLLCLIGSPFLQGAWKSADILFSKNTTEADDEQKKIYMLEEVQTNALGKLTSPSSKRSVILDLGLLLWESFYAQKINVTEDDEEADEEDETLPLFNALNCEMNKVRRTCAGDNVPWLDIISNCLNAYSEDKLDNEKLRTNLYITIFKPLRECLKSYQPRITNTKGVVSRPVPSPSLKSHFSERQQLDPKIYLCNYEHRMSSITAPRTPQTTVLTGSNTSSATVLSAPTPTMQIATTSNRPLLLDTVQTTDSWSWLERFDIANRQLASFANCNQSHPVKIAILDTGCNMDDPFFAGPGIYRADPTVRWIDFVDGTLEPVDEDQGQHGTALTCLLLRLAPDATIFVARVARDSDGLSVAREIVAKAGQSHYHSAFASSYFGLIICSQAILHAVREWDVDIISMSFGFSDQVMSIVDAMEQAKRIKEGRLLFFAAANNDGLNGPEMFPALYESVISVRGTNYDGSFIAQYDPKTWGHKEGSHCGTLARDVYWGWVQDERFMKSGCSVATPIMVAIAAGLISFVEQETHLIHHRNLIRTRRGMLSVFNHMADGQPERSRRVYLAPWQLFKNNQSPRSLVEYALSLLPQITAA